MSNWHRHTHTPGLTEDGATGDVACDHYRRYEEDIALMREIGLQAYRLSLSWSRILPAGTGAVNPAGLGFYERLIDRLLAAGIRPFVTLFHWDLPAALEDRGGWLNPESPRWFGEYARAVFRALGDRVPMWSTLNEPWVVTDGGYLFGTNAPAHRNVYEAPIAAHHLLLAHGAGVAAFRESGARGGIGLVVNLEPKYPASESAEDHAAAERADIYMNRQFLDPVFFGRYPEGLAEIFGPAWPHRGTSGSATNAVAGAAPAAAAGEPDLTSVRAPIDFLGVNYYTRGIVRHDETALPVRASSIRRPGALYTETGWEVFPQGLTQVLRWVRDRYGPIPIYVAENGAAFPDPPTSAAMRAAEDTQRIEYLRAHLRATHEAMGAAAGNAAGVDVRGTFVWSLLDNLEWSSGFTKRFGLVHVDFATLERTVKPSGRFYRDVIATRGAALGR
jgi:beta-glucosidase